LLCFALLCFAFFHVYLYSDFDSDFGKDEVRVAVRLELRESLVALRTLEKGAGDGWQLRSLASPLRQ
jgi:hypothetical protein